MSNHRFGSVGTSSAGSSPLALAQPTVRDSVTPLPSLMSVPRPAMFVAMVTVPG